VTPGDEGGPLRGGHPEKAPRPRRTWPESYREWVTDSAGAYGVMMDRPLTTTRTCAGRFCWCHVGSTVAWPLDHHDEMARMAREIRRLEVSQGVAS
jgi:hypothetical protein